MPSYQMRITTEPLRLGVLNKQIDGRTRQIGALVADFRWLVMFNYTPFVLQTNHQPDKVLLHLRSLLRVLSQIC